MYFLSNLCTFCVISFFNGVNLGVYCEKLRTYCVRFCWNVWINSVKCKRFSLVYSHYKPFMPFWCKLANVTNSAFFGLIFLPQKLCLCNLFDKYQVCVQPKQERNPDLCIKSWICDIVFRFRFFIQPHICKCGTFPGFWYFCRFSRFLSAPPLQVWYFSRSEFAACNTRTPSNTMFFIGWSWEKFSIAILNLQKNHS